MPTQTRSQGNRSSPVCAVASLHVGDRRGAGFARGVALDGAPDRGHAVLMDPLWILA